MGRMSELTDFNLRRSGGQSMAWSAHHLGIDTESCFFLTLCHHDSPLLSPSCLIYNQLLPVISTGGFCHHHPGPDFIILSGLSGCFSLPCQVHVPWTLFLSQVRLGKRMQPCVCGRSYYTTPSPVLPEGEDWCLLHSSPLGKACWVG